MDNIFQIFLVYLLLIVGVLSFTFFIRRLLVNAQVKITQIREINKKLDRLIELLEDKGK